MSGLFGGIEARGEVAARLGDEAWLQAMLDVEVALVRALARAEMASPEAAEAVAHAALPEHFDIDELGRQAGDFANPVLPLVRALRDAVRERPSPQNQAGASAEEAARAVHYGATSQDILDSAAMLLAARTLPPMLDDLAASAEAAAALAARYRDTAMMGRTLLQQAVPVTLGLTAAHWLTGLDEARTRLADVASDRLALQLGGAAGTLASLGERGPEVAALLAGELGLPDPGLPWHTVRTRVVELAGALAGASGACGKIARDVTLLAQNEVGELREGGGPERGGSSAMPHKRNPVAAVSALACTRRVPGLVATLTAAAEQEHQRAAGAWQSEWQSLTELLRSTASAAAWIRELLEGLEVDAGRMRANLELAGASPSHVGSAGVFVDRALSAHRGLPSRDEERR